MCAGFIGGGGGVGGAGEFGGGWFLGIKLVLQALNPLNL